MDKKQLKRIFNKNIIKDKSFIKMVCFTIVLLLVLVLGSNFGYVSADTTSYSHCLNFTDWQSSPFFVSNYYCEWFGGAINENDSIVFDYFCNTSDLLGTNPTMYDSTKYYLILGGSGGGYSTYINMYMFDDETLYFISNPYTYSNGWTIYTKSDSYEVMTYQTYGDGTNLMSITRPSDVVISYPLTNTKTINGETYYYFELGSSIDFPLLTNMNYYAFTSNVGYSDYVSTMDSYLTDGSYASDIYQLNYMYGSAPDLGGFSSLEGVSTPTTLSIETEANNMYADYADWILNNYTGDIWNNYRNVSVSFTSNLNDYIREHYNDTDYDNFSIWLDYNVYIDFYYQTVIDYGNLGGGVTLGSEFASVSLDYNHDMVFTDNYHWSCNYVFNPSSADSSYISSGYLLPMDTFIEDKNCVFTLGLDGLFAYLSPSDGSGNLIGSNGTRVHTNLTLSQLMTLVKDDAIVWSSSKDGLSQFKMTCTAKIIYDDFSGDDYSGSGTYIETFNLLDGTSNVDSNNMLTNYNPYITNTDEDVTSSLPSTSTSGSSVATSSMGNVTQTVNVTNEGAKYIPSIISSLIPSSFGDTSTGLASRFTTLVDSNNFITVMANTVPAVPTTVWTYLTEYLGISLYLLACAFVLRLILDLL